MGGAVSALLRGAAKLISMRDRSEGADPLEVSMLMVSMVPWCTVAATPRGGGLDE